MKNDKKSLIRSVFDYSISSWINVVIGFLSVMITTRIVSPDAYGIISIFISASSFLMYIFTFGMDGAYIRFYNDPPAKESKNQVLYRIIVYSSIIGIGVATLIIGPMYLIVSNYVFGKSSRMLVVMLALHAYSQAIFRFLNINFRMGFKTKQYTIQNILINCFSRIMIIITALLTDDVDIIIFAVGISMCVLLFVYVIIQRQEIRPLDSSYSINYSLSLKGYGSFIKFALYSAPSYFVTYFNSFISQTIIRGISGSYYLGVFTSCGMFKTILSGIQGGFSTFWSAYVYKNYDVDKNKISEMHEYVLTFAMIITSGFVIFRDVVYLFIGKQYHESKEFFSLLLIGAILGFIKETTDKGLAIAKKNEITLIAHAISVVINLVGCFFLTTRFGIIGAAVADAISSIILYILISLYGQKYYKTIKKPLKSMVATGLIVIVMVFPTISFSLINIIFFTILVDCIFALIMKKQIVSIMHVICTRIIWHKNNKEKY